jgi:hypothetical protein
MNYDNMCRHLYTIQTEIPIDGIELGLLVGTDVGVEFGPTVGSEVGAVRDKKKSKKNHQFCKFLIEDNNFGIMHRYSAK